MLGRTYDSQNCSVARALEAVGERWSLLIIREALFAGSTRFRDFQQNLGVASNTLTARLESFVADGLMERLRTGEHSDHFDYVLTEKGRSLQPTLIALAAWGDQWAAPDGPPTLFVHASCEHTVEPHIRCVHCDQALTAGEVVARSGDESVAGGVASIRPAARAGATAGAAGLSSYPESGS